MCATCGCSDGAKATVVDLETGRHTHVHEGGHSHGPTDAHGHAHEHTHETSHHSPQEVRAFDADQDERAVDAELEPLE